LARAVGRFVHYAWLLGAVAIGFMLWLSRKRPSVSRIEAVAVKT